jgi:hypothetical protein
VTKAASSFEAGRAESKKHVVEVLAPRPVSNRLASAGRSIRDDDLDTGHEEDADDAGGESPREPDQNTLEFHEVPRATT